MVEASARARAGVAVEPAHGGHLRYLTAEDVVAAKAELEGLPWGAIDPVPDYFLEVIASRPEVLAPMVVRLSSDGAEVGFAGRSRDAGTRVCC